MTKSTIWIEETFHPHWRVRLAAKDVLHEVKTDHQHLVIFDNETWGRVLMLDGVCQLTTSDEFVYHEMMAHVPLMALKSPRRVLVIGGGDGGVLREVLKHPSVEKATLVEIDRSVVDLSLKYYPEIAAGAFDDPRTELLIADGLKYVAETTERFDAIIVDSSEPIGPSAVLHTPQFFADCKRALADGGIFVTQNGLPFLAPGHLEETTRALLQLFGTVAPYLCTQPCYFGGPFALNWASDAGRHLEISGKKLARRQAKRGVKTRYWTPRGHGAAFDLPAYVQDIVATAMAPVPNAKPPRRKASAVAPTTGRPRRASAVRKTTKP